MTPQHFFPSSSVRQNEGVRCPEAEETSASEDHLMTAATVGSSGFLERGSAFCHQLVAWAAGGASFPCSLDFIT